MKILERVMLKWMNLLNACFDFGSTGVTEKGAKSALAILLLTVIVLGLLLTYLAMSGPEQLPGT